jgi:brefeldin A-inhibited guanine nucleotide-exchange protein
VAIRKGIYNKLNLHSTSFPGTNCLENFVISNGAKFTTQTWDRTCECIINIFSCTVSTDLLTNQSSLKSTSQYEHNNQQFHHNSIEHPSLLSDNRQGILKKALHQNHWEPEKHKNDPTISFSSLLIKCVVQLELIQTIDNILFYPTTSRKEDAETLILATADFKKSAQPTECQREEQGMYSYLNSTQLLMLAECLLQSHRFAKSYNVNSQQRNIIWNPTFNGSANAYFLKQETQSLACVFRILFKMYEDESRRSDWAHIEKRLISVCKESIGYFLTLQTDAHRDAWISLLLLVMTRLLKMQDERVSINIIGKCYAI